MTYIDGDHFTNFLKGPVSTKKLAASFKTEENSGYYKSLPMSCSEKDPNFTALETGKKTRRSRARTDNKANPIKDKKKRRLEQNRISARESRKKKKLYISNLESKIAVLKKVADESKNKKEPEVIMKDYQPTVCTCGMQEFTKNINASVNMLIEAANKKDALLLYSELDKVRRLYIEEPDDAKRVVGGLLNSLIQCIIPRSFARLLWMAKNNTDIFEDNVIQEEESKSEHSQQLNREVTEALQLDEKEREYIKDFQGTVKDYADRFIEHFRKLKQVTNDLFIEVQALNNSLKTQLLPKLDPNITVGYLNWIVHHPDNLHFYKELNNEPDTSPLPLGDNLLQGIL